MKPKRREEKVYPFKKSQYDPMWTEGDIPKNKVCNNSERVV